MLGSMCAIVGGPAKLCVLRMQVEVTTPEDHMGDVIGDLNSRRGLVGEFLDKPGNMRVSTLPSLS